MRGWKIPSVIAFAVISTFTCLAQSNHVTVQTLRLDGNPNIVQRCPSNDYMNVDWVDGQTLLVRYVLQPCRKDDEIRFGYTTLDLQGRTIAFADSDVGFKHPGPPGGILASNRKRNVQLLDTHFAVLKTIDCVGHAVTRIYLRIAPDLLFVVFRPTATVAIFAALEATTRMQTIFPKVFRR
jgi:hypothetical protein